MSNTVIDSNEMNVQSVTTETKNVRRHGHLKKFLSRIFHVSNPELFTYLWQRNELEKKGRKTQFFKTSDLESMSKCAADFNQKPFGVSFSMGLVDKPKTKEWKDGITFETRASDADIVALSCLWCDIDVKSDYAHSEQNLFESVDDILTMFESKLKPRGLFPNIIVNSGHGIHAYWIPNKLILAQSDEEKKHARKLVADLQLIIRELSGGYVVDKTDELSKMLRIPNSKNWKGAPDVESAPTAEVIFDDDAFFNIDELTERIETAMQQFRPISHTPSEMSQRNIDAVAKMNDRNFSRSKNKKVIENSRDDSELVVTNGDVQTMIENCSFIRHVVENLRSISEPMAHDAFSNLLRANNSFDFIIQLYKDQFGSDFDEDFTRERLGHYQTQKPTSCTKIRESCPSCNAEACIVHRLKRKVPAAIVTSDEVQKSIESVDKTLGDVIDDVPPEISHFRIPMGFLINDQGIFEIVKSKPAMRSLCFISKVITEFDAWGGRNTFYELTAMTNHNWDRFELPAELVKESRSVTSILAAKGIKIDSNCAKYAVSFFTAFESANDDLIPHVNRFTKTGWNGSHFIIPRDDNFKRDDNNLFEVNAGESSKFIHSNGNRVESLNLILDARKFNAVRTMIDAALASMIIQKLNCNNFAVNFWGRSGTGKTASLRLANSLFANPKFIVDFHSTDNALVNAFTERNDLPTFANEYQLASRKTKDESGGDIIHRFESGESKKRLDRSAKSRLIQYFSGVMCITAEQMILNDNVEGGKKRRLLEIHFDQEIPPEMCKKFYSLTRDNYGFIAREFIHFFESDSSRFDFAKSKRDMFETMIRESCQNVVASHIDYISILILVDYLFQIWVENIDEQTAVKNALNYSKYLMQFAITKDELSDSQRAKSYIVDWYNVHEMNFLRADQRDSRIVREIYGYYDTIKKIPMIFPSVLKNALSSGGFSPNKILAEWKDEGVISFDGKQYSKMFVCCDGIRRRLTQLDFLSQKDSNGGDSSNTTKEGYSRDETPFPDPV